MKRWIPVLALLLLSASPILAAERGPAPLDLDQTLGWLLELWQEAAYSWLGPADAAMQRTEASRHGMRPGSVAPSAPAVDQPIGQRRSSSSGIEPADPTGEGEPPDVTPPGNEDDFRPGLVPVG